jgi:hypothetical protein
MQQTGAECRTAWAYMSGMSQATVSGIVQQQHAVQHMHAQLQTSSSTATAGICHSINPAFFKDSAGYAGRTKECTATPQSEQH